MSAHADSQTFNRIVGIHKPDCEMLMRCDPIPEASIPGEAELVAALGSEQTAEYAMACRRIYEDLRRVIGQLAGLMILARVTRKIEFVELEQVDNCTKRWTDAGARIAALKAHGPVARHKQQIELAHDFCGRILRTFPQLTARTDLDIIFDEIGDHLKQAYACLSRASSHEAGLVMVDFSNACCSCGR
ncbi:MAG: hypothetical protein CML29_06130 [Rhizobiales bacterium]|nr:hypothetical protein [Hyphomicrobiales bacterium]MBA69360.1 hypothetical protein [Hyphomicrobiales bacterium]|tara:strand:- start:1384 stop:1947 length:564 start_codon:yes stop_codon:yes gene_type:complete